MAVVPATSSRSGPLAWLQAAWNAGTGWMAAVVGLCVGIVVYQTIGEALTRAQPVEVTIHRIEVINSPPGVRGQTLFVEMESPTATNCRRITEQLLYRDVNGKRFYYPVGSALDGMGFFGSHYAFTLVLSLPTDMQPGEYSYIQRSAYNCDWLGGFISRRLFYQTSPRLIHIGP